MLVSGLLHPDSCCSNRFLWIQDSVFTLIECCREQRGIPAVLDTARLLFNRDRSLSAVRGHYVHSDRTDSDRAHASSIKEEK